MHDDHTATQQGAGASNRSAGKTQDRSTKMSPMWSLTVLLLGSATQVVWAAVEQQAERSVQPDYITRALLFGFAFALVIAIASFALRDRLVGWKRNSRGFHYFSEGGEWVFAILLSGIASFFEIFKSGTWEDPKSGLVGSFTVWVAIVAIYIVIKFVGASAKRQDAETIAALNAQLGDEKIKSETLARQRNAWLTLTAYIRKIVDQKMRRVVQALGGKNRPSKEDLIAALDPSAQLHLIVTTIHHYFLGKAKPNEQIRLGIYVRDELTPNQLKRIYAWDGQKTDCFSTRVLELARLDDPNGMQSQLVRCFHSSAKTIIIESCLEAAKTGDFHFFPGQERYLRSMILYKHVFEHDGTHDALIITLDSSQEFLFMNRDEEEIATFLSEMMKRIEFELTFKAISQKVSDGSSEASHTP
jgi:hypothetical protein